MKLLIIALLMNFFLIKIETKDDSFLTKEYIKTEHGIKFLPMMEMDTIYIYGNNYQIDTLR